MQSAVFKWVSSPLSPRIKNKNHLGNMNYLVQNKQNQSVLMCTKQQFMIHNTIFMYSIHKITQ